MRPRRQLLSPGFSRFGGLSRAARGAGAVLLALGVVAVWSTRLASEAQVYLSEMGASDASTPLVFNSALLVIALGGGLVALGRPGIRSNVRILSACTVSATLLFSCLCIAFASRVTCSPGCPVPFTSGSTFGDFAHTLAATLGFAGVGLAIIQAAFAPRLRPLFAVSIAGGVLIIVSAGIGGLLSVFRFHTELGGWFELAATTIALLWVIVFALVPGLRQVPGMPAAAGSAVGAPGSGSGSGMPGKPAAVGAAGDRMPGAAVSGSSASIRADVPPATS